MKLTGILILLCAVPFVARAQTPPPEFNELIDAGQQWAQENIDEDVLSVLKELELPTVQDFFDVMLRQLQSEDVIDLDKLEQMAVASLPMLEAHKETQSYAQWLKPRMDYFDVAGQFRAATPQRRAPQPGHPPEPIPNPPPEKEREVWKKELEKRPPPKGAEDFATRLKPIFAAQQVPSALVWVAEVESSFSPSARSPAGAAGLFQLMPATAKSMDLSMWPRDQRLNPEKNAKGAAQYLKTLHNRFKDWPLALAAYNSGEGRVQALLRKHKAKTYDAIATHLPAETQMYVPKINATLLRREGISLAELGPQ